MSSRSFVAAFGLLVLAGCSGNGVSDITGSGPPGPVASIEISPTLASLQAGGTIQLTATAKDASRRTIPTSTFAWSSNAILLASVSASGLVYGVSVGNPTIMASETTTGITASRQVGVTAPPRPAGSLLVLGSESVTQYGEPLPVTTLGITDTSSVGSDYRVGIAHVQLPNAALNLPVSRVDFPL